MAQMAYLVIRQSNLKQIFARSERTPLDAVILAYGYQQSASEITPPGGGLTAVVIAMVTA
jgi:hypothetical protein